MLQCFETVKWRFLDLGLFLRFTSAQRNNAVIDSQTQKVRGGVRGVVRGGIYKTNKIHLGGHKFFPIFFFVTDLSFVTVMFRHNIVRSCDSNLCVDLVS